MKWFTVLCLQVGWLVSQSQPNLQMIKTDLQPNKIYGRQSFLKRNLSFAGYQTSKIRRTFSPLNLFGTINPFNTILRVETVPLQYEERYRAKDVFRFTLNRDDGTILTTECRALLKVREKFTLLRKQDSSFWGDKNVDFLIASIVPRKDTADKWTFMASNLNATNDGPQKGKLIGRKEELSFELTNLVLRQNANAQSTQPSFIGMDMVYAFTYKGEIVGAVSTKEAHRKFWIMQEVEQEIKDVLAAASVILIIRQDLYRQKSYIQ